MLVHSLASKYARFVVLVRQMYWTPPPSDHWTPPLLKSDDLFFREPRDIGPPPFKNPGHAPELNAIKCTLLYTTHIEVLSYIPTAEPIRYR